MSGSVFDMHRHRDEMRKRSREEVTSIACLAGFKVERMWELANGYWPDAPDYDDVRRPWWLLQTEIGLVRIGWRKRVIEIDWEACAVRGVVTADEVTKEDSLVHAYSVEKAVTYLRELRRLAAAGGAS